MERRKEGALLSVQSIITIPRTDEALPGRIEGRQAAVGKGWRKAAIYALLKHS